MAVGQQRGAGGCLRGLGGLYGGGSRAHPVRGDVLGLVLFLTSDDRAAGETEYKLAQTVAAFLGKNMES